VILVDTSVWVEHWRSARDDLARALDVGVVLGHPWVLGEALLGGVPGDSEARGLLELLPQATLATDGEVVRLIEQRDLTGCGIGYVDAGLLASALLTADARLWTRDGRLATVAGHLGVGMDRKTSGDESLDPQKS
jgi:predicted nucleic acid-binding protein